MQQIRCPLFGLEPEMTTRELHDRARRTLGTALTVTAQARLQRLAEHPNADEALVHKIRHRMG